MRLACRMVVDGRNKRCGTVSRLWFELELVWLPEHTGMREALFTTCFKMYQVSFEINGWFSFLLTHLHLQSSTALGSSSHAIVGYAAVNAVIAVFHAQDGEELTVLPNAVPGVKEPVGRRALWQVRAPSVMFWLWLNDHTDGLPMEEVD